jgi:hypothetical protein
MTPRPRRRDRAWRLLLPALILALAAMAALPGVRAAQPARNLTFLYADRRDDKAARAELQLRPNVEQKFFVYLQNNNPADETVTVEVLAGEPEEVVARSKPVPAKAGGKTFVDFAPPPPENPPAGKPATPPAPPALPALAEVKGPLKLRLRDKENKELGKPETLNVARPADYLERPVIEFDPANKNRLTVLLQAKAQEFGGPPCRVDLLLRPDRIPGLVVGPDSKGTRGGFLLRPGGKLALTAEELTFTESGKTGLVYLTIDGYQRAFTFSTDFPRGSVSTPDLIQTPIVRLNAPPVANPAVPYPVGLEVDNTPRDARVELGFDRDNNGEFREEDGEITLLRGDRRERLFLNAAVPEGCLLLRPEVEDWSAQLDLKGIEGKRTVRLRVLKPEGEGRWAPLDLRDSEKWETVQEVKKTIILDGSPPQGLRFVDFPEQLVRGDPLPVKAVARDEQSQIQKVVFFLGKPGPDGKLPPTAVPVPGKLAEKDKDLWTAALDAPTDQKAKLEVTVQATNGANLTASETVVIKLVDAPAGGVKLGTIEGDVVQGERKQPGVAVSLLDPLNVVKDSTSTDEKGHYVFKDVLPGAYRAVAAKSSDNTRGAANVTVQAGQKKTGVDVKLFR